MGIRIFGRLMLLPALVVVYLMPVAMAFRLLTDSSAILSMTGVFLAVVLFISFRQTTNAFVFTPIQDLISSTEHKEPQ